MSEKKENKDFPDLYVHTEREQKKLGLDLVSRQINPVTVQDASNCPHKFSMEGLYSIKCSFCGWGLVVSGLKEGMALIKRLTAGRQ